jgi:hypothetical protein
MNRNQVQEDGREHCEASQQYRIGQSPADQTRRGRQHDDPGVQSPSEIAAIECVARGLDPSVPGIQKPVGHIDEPNGEKQEQSGQPSDGRAQTPQEQCLPE